MLWLGLNLRDNLRVIRTEISGISAWTGACFKIAHFLRVCVCVCVCVVCVWWGVEKGRRESIKTKITYYPNSVTMGLKTRIL